MIKGVKCPLCRVFYPAIRPLIEAGYIAGEICESQAMTGRNPGKCSPEHPCPGILVPVFDEEQDTD